MGNKEQIGGGVATTFHNEQWRNELAIVLAEAKGEGRWERIWNCLPKAHQDALRKRLEQVTSQTLAPTNQEDLR